MCLLDSGDYFLFLAERLFRLLLLLLLVNFHWIARSSRASTGIVLLPSGLDQMFRVGLDDLLNVCGLVHIRSLLHVPMHLLHLLSRRRGGTGSGKGRPSGPSSRNIVAAILLVVIQSLHHRLGNLSVVGRSDEFGPGRLSPTSAPAPTIAPVTVIHAAVIVFVGNIAGHILRHLHLRIVLGRCHPEGRQDQLVGLGHILQMFRHGDGTLGNLNLARGTLVVVRDFGTLGRLGLVLVGFEGFGDAFVAEGMEAGEDGGTSKGVQTNRTSEG